MLSRYIRKLTRAYFLIIVIFFLGSCEYFAQQTIHGCIQEEKNGRPLPFVVIFDLAGESGDVSGDNGCFVLNVEKLPVELEFRLVGYENKKLIVTNLEEISVTLKLATFILNQVEVTSFSLEKIAGNERRSIWDYAWLDGNLLLCEYGNSLTKSRMILMTCDGDTLAMTNTPERPTGMFNDCMGNAYLLSRDSLWEFALENDFLSRSEAESAELVDRVLQYCIGENAQALYFAIPRGAEERIGQDEYAYRYKTNNDYMVYSIFDKKTEQLNQFKIIEDKFVVNLKNDEEGPVSGHLKKIKSSPYSGAESKMFFYKMMCKEIDAPMYYMRDSLFIFDHTNASLEVYDQRGQFIRELKIDYHNLPEYCRMSIRDEEKQHVYVLFDNNGIITLRIINTEDGLLGVSFTIPHLFPEHITIKGNYLYYIHRDENVHNAHILSRLRMR